MNELETADPIDPSVRLPWLTTLRKRYLAASLWVGFLTLAVAMPWLQPGYIFGTDFAGPRHYLFPNGPASYEALRLALALVGLVLPAEAVGKLLIVSLLFTAGLTAFRAVPTGGFLPRAVAAGVYLINPFVYERLAYGQLNVLGGYAVLPWVIASMWALLVSPRLTRAIVVAVAFAVVAIVDIHLALIAGIVSAVMVLTKALSRVRDAPYLKQLSKSVVVAGLLAAGASAYWLLPDLAGSGQEAATLASISAGDLVAFRTASDPTVGLVPNILGLYGFWAERTGRFVSLKEFVPVWPVLLGILLVLVAFGGIAAWRRANTIDFESSRTWVVALMTATAIAIVLEIGVSDAHVAPLIHWLDSALAPYRGLRDAEKWGAILALTYSQLIALGVISLVGWTKGHTSARRQELVVSLVSAAVLALPLYYGNGLLYGMHGQIKPSAYPAGWYAADHMLAADLHPGRTLFLPWHGYLALSFVRNTNDVVASPAPLFFSVPIVASQNLEVPGVIPPADPDQIALSRLVTEGPQFDWAPVLSERNIKYVLLAREVDWKSYQYLNDQFGLKLVRDYGSIVLYQNLMWNQAAFTRDSTA